jgi:hypothetical protein
LGIRKSGIKNEELINLLEEEYERRKESTNYMFHSNRGINEDLSSRKVGGQTDGGNVQEESRQVQRTQRKGLVNRSNGGTRISQEELEGLRRSALTILESMEDVPTIQLEEDFGIAFSFTNAPVPTEDETKGEYTKRLAGEVSVAPSAPFSKLKWRHFRHLFA